MIAFKLAYRNLMGAGLRTWLIVFVLSLSYVIIIGHKGLLDGWNKQAQTDMINWEVGGGQYWQQEFDPYDLFTIIDSHSIIPDEIQKEIENDKMTPMLFTQATVYPEGRQQTIILKGIDPNQQIIKIPSSKLETSENIIPTVIGRRMASSNKLKIGDFVIVRWRDVNGIYDANEVKIVDIFKTNVPSIDNAQMYIPLEKLQSMLLMPNEATIIIKEQESDFNKEFNGWDFKDQDFLMKTIIETIKAKNIGGLIMWGILLLLALLAIFDTQILSVFRRQKEIGTYIALGMTRAQIIRLFTIEGAMHGILAAIAAAVYGIPLLSLLAKHGWTIPMPTDDYGLAISETLYPLYSLGLIAGTVSIILITTTIVSYLPVRKISKMKPTDAIKGKLQ